MKLGIVGSEAAKFTVATEMAARKTIQGLIEVYMADTVVSGGCHLGGIDEWAEHEAETVGCKTEIFLPKVQSWLKGYRPRNIQIAKESDVVVCITVKELPPGYEGMRFGLCYHCRVNTHVKSGGCWTVKYAKEKLGKPGEIIVI